MTIHINNTPEAHILAGFDIYWKGIGEQAAALIQSQNKGLDRRRLRLTSDVNLPVTGVEQAKEPGIVAGQKGH